MCHRLVKGLAKVSKGSAEFLVEGERLQPKVGDRGSVSSGAGTSEAQLGHTATQGWSWDFISSGSEPPAGPHYTPVRIREVEVTEQVTPGAGTGHSIRWSPAT